MTKIAVPVTVDITPEILAEAFWELSDEEQVKFFNHLGVYAPDREWKRQLEMIRAHPLLTFGGNLRLRQIVEVWD